MTERQRIRVGREVTYFPTDAEAAAGGGDVGTAWFGKITSVAADGSVGLHVLQADGAELALTGILSGQSKGTFALHGGNIAHHT